jgi:hypothetical protein
VVGNWEKSRVIQLTQIMRAVAIMSPGRYAPFGQLARSSDARATGGLTFSCEPAENPRGRRFAEFETSPKPQPAKGHPIKPAEPSARIHVDP